MMTSEVALLFSSGGVLLGFITVVVLVAIAHIITEWCS